MTRGCAAVGGRRRPLGVAAGGRAGLCQLGPLLRLGLQQGLCMRRL